MIDTLMDKDRSTRPTRKRPVPYEQRAKKPGAGIVSPSARPPASAKLLSKWNLAEAKRQGQVKCSAALDLIAEAKGGCK